LLLALFSSLTKKSTLIASGIPSLLICDTSTCTLR
jgi:hypothetical protein